MGVPAGDFQVQVTPRCSLDRIYLEVTWTWKSREAFRYPEAR